MRTLNKIPGPRVLLALALAAFAITPARADYSSTVLADKPQAYYRFGDKTNRTLINVNSGSLGSAGNASNDLAFVTYGAVHPFPGAIVGDNDRSEFFDFSTRTEIPFTPGVNPPATQPFTVEAWLYPASDQVSTGMGALCNRWTQDGFRQGWVLYQRAPDTNHCTTCGPGVGWEFRMFNGLDGSGHVDVTSGVPFTVGAWQHVAVVYIPVDGDPTNSMAIIYVNGVAAATNINVGGIPGYEACTGDHDPSVAIYGQPALSVGGYNNANNDTPAGFGNPWFGAVDEFALYATNLSPAQILSHYQSGTNASRAQPYATLIQSASPVAYLRLDEIAPNVDIANNVGDVRNTGIGTNTPGVVHPSAGALAGETTDGASSYNLRGGSTTTDLPWQAENNPDAGTPFTFEIWLRPTNDRISPGAAPVNNRYVSSGNRTGWVIFQRAPDPSYAGYTPDYEGTGWNFRMYSGEGSGGQDVLTSTDWVPGVWQHLVFTWEPQVDNGDVGGNGNDQWEGILTAYMNGAPVATNSSALYEANVNPTEDGTMPADFAVGSYNAASGLGSNPYEGDVDELALYNDIVLTPDQILAHYQAATNPNYGTNYEVLVFAAGGLSVTNDSGIIERADLPATYLRFNDAPFYAATNSGALGSAADASLVLTTNIAPGLQPPVISGIAQPPSLAVPLDGQTMFANLNNPDGLNISNQITLEAWILPAGTQGQTARIISHGPETISTYPGPNDNSLYGPFVNAITNTSEVFLRIENDAQNYSVGTSQFSDDTGLTNLNEATAAVPAGDLGGTKWIHLAGTYDGSAWNLYRNGVLAAKQASTNGAVAIGDANWAIGATGEGWADNFAGNVAQVAIYDYALTASQIAAHYAAGTGGATAPTLTIALTATNQVTLTWSAGNLQSATALTGPYTTLTSATSPYQVTVTNAAAVFYRAVNP